MPRLMGISSESSTAEAAEETAATGAFAALSPESPLLSVLEAMLAALRWERSCGAAGEASAVSPEAESDLGAPAATGVVVLAEEEATVVC